MKVKCLENVQDKYTGELYKVNNVYDLSKERAEEVSKTKYFELVEEVKEEVKEVKPKKSVKKSTK